MTFRRGAVGRSSHGAMADLHLLLVVADTRANRRILAEFRDLFVQLPRLRTASVLKTLSVGDHPPSGIILI